MLKFGQILEILLKNLKGFKKILSFQENFNKNLENLTKIEIFPTIDSHSLSSNKFVFAGTFLRFRSEPLLYVTPEI